MLIQDARFTGTNFQEFFATHPSHMDRFKSLMLLAARGYADNEVVPIPAGAKFQAWLDMSTQRGTSGLTDVAREVIDIAENQLTAGQIRQRYSTHNYDRLGKNVTQFLVDLLQGTTTGMKNMAEARADEAAIYGLRRPVTETTSGMQKGLQYSDATKLAGAVLDPELGFLLPLDAQRERDRYILDAIDRVIKANPNVPRPEVLLAVDRSDINAFGTRGTGGRSQVVINQGLYDMFVRAIEGGTDPQIVDSLLLHEMSHTTSDDLGKTLLMRGADYLRRLNARAVGVESDLTPNMHGDIPIREVTPETKGAPQRGVWADRFKEGPAEGASERAMRFFQQAMSKIAESNASKGTAKRIRLRSQAQEAWTKYEAELAGSTEREAVPTGNASGPENGPNTLPVEQPSPEVPPSAASQTPVPGDGVPGTQPDGVPNAAPEGIVDTPAPTGDVPVPGAGDAVPATSPTPGVKTTRSFTEVEDAYEDLYYRMLQRYGGLQMSNMDAPTSIIPKGERKALRELEQDMKDVQAGKEVPVRDTYQVQEPLRPKPEEPAAVEPTPATPETPAEVPPTDVPPVDTPYPESTLPPQVGTGKGKLSERRYDQLRTDLDQTPDQIQEEINQYVYNFAEDLTGSPDPEIGEWVLKTGTLPKDWAESLDYVSSSVMSELKQARQGYRDLLTKLGVAKKAEDTARRYGVLEHILNEKQQQDAWLAARRNAASPNNLNSAAGGLMGAAAGEATGQDTEDDDWEVPIQNIAVMGGLGAMFGRKKLNTKLANDAILSKDPVIKMMEAPTRGGGNKQYLTLSERAHDFWRNRMVPVLTDEIAALQGFQNDMARVWKQATGTPLPAEVMAAELKRFDPMRASEITVREYIRPILLKIEELGVPRAQVEAYLMHVHNQDIAKAVRNKNRTFPANIKAAESSARQKALEAAWQSHLSPTQYAELQAEIQKVWDYGDRLLDMKLKAGLISEENYKALRKAFPHYIPTRILEHLTDDKHVALGKSLSVTSSTIYNLTRFGTEAEAMSIFAALVGETRKTYAAAHKNTIFNKFVDLWDMASGRQTSAGFMIPVGTYDPATPTNAVERRLSRYADGIIPWQKDEKPPDGYVSVQGFRNGEKMKFIVSEELGDITKYASPTVIPIISGLMAAFRAGATARNPAFLTANMMLDFAGYTIREGSRNNGDFVTPAIEWMKAAYEFLPVGTMAGGIGGGYAGAQTIQEDDSNLERFAKVGGGMLAGGGIGAAVDHKLPGRHGDIWNDIITHTFRGDMKRFLEQGGGSAGAYYNTNGRAPEDYHIVGKKFLKGLDADKWLKRLGINQEGDLQKDVNELTRGAIDISSGAQFLRVARDAVFLKPVEMLGERIEMVPRVAAMRMAERRSQVGINQIKKQMDAVQAYTTSGVKLPKEYADKSGRPLIPLDELQRRYADAQERMRIEGTQAGRTTTIDFNKGGTWSKMINQLVPFFNVGVQALADIGRAAEEKPKAFPAIVAGAIIAPALATEVWNNWDSQRARDYADVPQYMKDQGLVIMLDRNLFPPVKDDQGNDHPQFFHFRYRQFAPFSNLTREFLQRTVYAGSPSDAYRRSWGEALLSGGLSPTLPVSTNSWTDFAMNFVPPGISTTIQLGTNYDTFRDSRIESHKSDDRASPLSKGLAATFGGRPSQWQFGTSDVGTGYAGMLHGASQVFADEPPKGPSSTPFVGGLTGRWVKGSIGGGAEYATDNLLTPSAESLLTRNKVKWRPSIADPEVEGVQLTRQEQARYQLRLNSATDNAIQRYFRDSNLSGLTPTEIEEGLQKEVNFARSIARDEFVRSIPTEEWNKRYNEAWTKRYGTPQNRSNTGRPDTSRPSTGGRPNTGRPNTSRP